MHSPPLTAFALGLALANFAHGQTTTFRFDGVGSQTINLGYGDRVTGPTSGGFTYDGTGIFTPNVIATWGFVSNNVAYSPGTWPTGYNDLVNVLYAPAFGTPGSTDAMVLTFVADPGYEVSIEAFDVGNYGVAITVPSIRVFDEAGTVLFEELDVALNAGSSPMERNFVLAPPVASRVLTLSIALDGLTGNAANVGLDNLTIGQRTAAPSGIGASYCGPGNPNSTGGPGVIRAWGETSVAANDVRLYATGLPLESFGFFLTSRTTGFVANPAGSAGNLCLGGSIGRYVGPGEIQNTSAAGGFGLTLDLTRMPTPTGLVPAQAGETWNFQAWHRDVGSTSNFTDALGITLQ